MTLLRTGVSALTSAGVYRVEEPLRDHDGLAVPREDERRVRAP